MLHAIATSVTTGLNITSSFFLANMNEKRFTKSLARWKSFIEPVDLEVCSSSHMYSHMHVDSVFHLSGSLGRIAMMSCPVQVDKTSSRCAQEFVTNFVFQDAFGGLKIKHRSREVHVGLWLGTKPATS